MSKPIRVTNLDAIITSVPLTKTAARVVASGEHYAPPIAHLNQAHSDVCPPLKTTTDLREPSTVAILHELVGKRSGRLTVIGILNDPNRSQRSKAAWVVRCVCGRYETRKRKALLEANSDGEDRCSACWSLEKIKRSYKELGSRDFEEFIPKPINHRTN